MHFLDFFWLYVKNKNHVNWHLTRQSFLFFAEYGFPIGSKKNLPLFFRQIEVALDFYDRTFTLDSDPIRSGTEIPEVFRQNLS